MAEEADYSIDHLLSRVIVDEREYRCQACENLCPIRVIKVDESRHHFGGRCNKYANLRKQIKIDEQAAVD
jgi:Fe-S-cluster-containing hydrogenase component 2